MPLRGNAMAQLKNAASNQHSIASLQDMWLVV
jgi:hypothetical protein